MSAFSDAVFRSSNFGRVERHGFEYYRRGTLSLDAALAVNAHGYEPVRLGESANVAAHIPWQSSSNPFSPRTGSKSGSIGKAINQKACSSTAVRRLSIACSRLPMPTSIVAIS